MSWPSAKISEIATIDRDGISPSEILQGTLYVGLENVESGGRLVNVGPVESGELASTKFRFGSNHVLYGKLRPYLAKIATPNFEGICSTDILPVLPGPRLDRNYLSYFLRQPSMVAIATSRSEGANLPRLSPKALSDFEIPLPPLPEQQRIAAILDAADALRQKRRQVLHLLDQLSQSIFIEMFGDPVVNPKGWEDARVLGDFADIASGITKGRRLSGATVREVPYLAVYNVQDKALRLDQVKSIEATEEEIERYRLEANDLLLTEGGDPDKLGRGTLWKNEMPECIHQNHIFRVRIHSDEVEPLYLNWLVGSQRGKQYFLRSAKQTTGIASINMTQLRAFPMLVPPRPLQREFTKRIAALKATENQAAAHESALDGMFSSLQHRAFNGEL